MIIDIAGHRLDYIIEGHRRSWKVMEGHDHHTGYGHPGVRESHRKSKDVIEGHGRSCIPKS